MDQKLMVFSEFNSQAKETRPDTDRDNESQIESQTPPNETGSGDVPEEDELQGPTEPAEGLEVESVQVIEMKNGELLQVNQEDQRALENASPDDAVLPSCMPPAKLSKGAIQKRLWRIVQPKANGSFKVPQDVIDEYKDEHTRKNVESLFEKSGYQRDWFWGWTKVLKNVFVNLWKIDSVINTVGGKSPEPLGVPEKFLKLRKKTHFGHPMWCRILSINMEVSNL